MQDRDPGGTDFYKRVCLTFTCVVLVWIVFQLDEIKDLLIKLIAVTALTG